MRIQLGKCQTTHHRVRYFVTTQYRSVGLFGVVLYCQHYFSTCVDFLCLFCLWTPRQPTHRQSRNFLSNCLSCFFLHILTDHLASCSAVQVQASLHPPWLVRIKRSSESSHGINSAWFMQLLKWVNEEEEFDNSRASGLSANKLEFWLLTILRHWMMSFSWVMWGKWFNSLFLICKVR